MRNKKLIIFGAIAIGGVIATAATTAWGTFKASKVLEEEKPETKKEAVKLIWKYYIPAGIAVSATIISDICFYRIGLKELAALTASVTYLTSNRDKLEKKLKEVVGEEKYKEIKKEITKELFDEEKAKQSNVKPSKNMPVHHRFAAEETGYGDTLFLDGWSGRFFRSSIEEVLSGIEKFNDAFHGEIKLQDGTTLKGCPVSWNEFYEFMHICPTHQGHDFGYPANEDWINLDEDLIDPETDITRIDEGELMTGYRDIGEDIYVIEPHEHPMLCWQEL